MGKMSAANDGKIEAGCPLDRTLRLLWREWTTHILWVLGQSGPTSFGDLRRRLNGISPKVLAERLRRMESDVLVHREQQPIGRRRATYGLTDKGQDIHSALLSFGGVAERWP
jgi:DNA-binding HxlR family transcriptional regulator